MPDYRGAGASSHPATSPTVFASRLWHLTCANSCAIVSVIVGHDIGGMIAYAYATRYRNEGES